VSSSDESHVTVVLGERVTCSCGYTYVYASEPNARLGATLHRLSSSSSSQLVRTGAADAQRILRRDK